MEPSPIYEKNLLAWFLFSEWTKDRSRTLSWWSSRWKVPLTLIEKWVQGSRRIGAAHSAIFVDLPFTEQDYYVSAWEAFLSDEPPQELPAEFVVGTTSRVDQTLPQAFLPRQTNADASAAFDLLRRKNDNPVVPPPPISGEPIVASEILDAVLDRGRLTKEEMVETWGLMEEQYREIHAKLSSDRRIDSGPPRSGGLIATFNI